MYILIIHVCMCIYIYIYPCMHENVLLHICTCIPYKPYPRADSEKLHTYKYTCIYSSICKKMYNSIFTYVYRIKRVLSCRFQKNVNTYIHTRIFEYICEKYVVTQLHMYRMKCILVQIPENGNPQSRFEQRESCLLYARRTFLLVLKCILVTCVCICVPECVSPVSE